MENNASNEHEPYLQLLDDPAYASFPSREEKNDDEEKSPVESIPAPAAAAAADKENSTEDMMNDTVDFSEPSEKDPAIIAQLEIIANTPPSTKLEFALAETLKRKEAHVERIINELKKLRKFISKRKQTYKRKRKNDGAPIRALSAYNIFIKERFAQLAKENEEALKSEDKSAALRRVPPASLVAKTGNEWKNLPPEEKAKYEERAKGDKKRYDEEMAQYKPPSQDSNRKRNKTGYNMFFSAHVVRLKQTESGVPSERGSVARLVGTAWKRLSAEDKAMYEREADKHNGMRPGKDEEDEEHPEEQEAHHQIEYHYAPPEMHMPPPPMQMMPDHHRGHQHHGYYATPHVYGPPPPYGYDYSQHHQRHQQARAQGYQQGYHPPTQHGYERTM